MIRLRITQKIAGSHMDQEVDLIYSGMNDNVKWVMTEIINHAVDNTKIEISKEEVADEVREEGE